MPTITTVCPHCEKNVEFNVTSVTRSRPCPHCGKPVLLQVAAATKRKALLVANQAAEPTKEEVGTNSAQEQTAPKVLEGDVRRRMLHDPEVQASMRQFKWGAAVVGLLVVLVAALGYLDAWNKASDFFTGIGKHSKNGDMSDFDPANAAPKPKVVLPQGPVAGRSEPKVPQSSEAELGPALKAAAAFLGAQTPDERFATIRDQKLLHDRFYKYYETHPSGPIPFERVEPHATNPEGAMTFAFVVVMPNGSKQKMIVGKARSGDYMVDWASFVHYGELELADFKARRPTQPVLFRMLAQADRFYGGIFSSSNSLLCVKFTDPRVESGMIYGYVAKASTLGRSMDFILGKSLGQAVPVIVTLKYPEGADTDNQVWISELITEGWVASGR